MTTAHESAPGTASGPSVFARVVAGVNGVSERVAHDAPCSVLVVRTAA